MRVLWDGLADESTRSAVKSTLVNGMFSASIHSLERSNSEREFKTRGMREWREGGWRSTGTQMVHQSERHT